ncbi:GNAT family N-acetyltransferase [Diaphorobacter caeni]|uniref:GNAT family N-acetyltransferase n=1 Tax=Diaphorobacter caeni TaxID=2784387 RepID=UPI001890A350|nr:GNAT family N-acetyltransferase [Diaphorobacter caeni]MBF5003807.1 N-acetyltransferase [Diaphorobacter caeni]
MTDSTTSLKFVSCSFERHAEAILAIFNDAIENSTALYDYKARTMDNMVAWFDAKQKNAQPVIGIEDPQTGELLGFASWGAFRAYPAYKYTVEHSVYVHSDHRGKGLGMRLMNALIETARQSDKVHALIGAIDAANGGSIALHERLGFRHVGTLPQVGFKFGRWLDLAFYQLMLEATPAQPVDG